MRPFQTHWGALRDLADIFEGFAPSRLGAAIDLLGKPASRSYSFYGEDAVVRGTFARLKFERGDRSGSRREHLSYVDVGAWRPVLGNNTYWLYRAGASGTVVEPNPKMARLLKRVRRRDDVLQVACGELPTVDYFVFGAHAESNTTNPEFARFVETSQGRSPVKTISTPAMSLTSILDAHLSKHPSIFLLSIDIEGDDLTALQSVTWSGAYRPRFLIAEVAVHTPSMHIDEPVTAFLSGHRYELLAQCGVSRVFVNTDAQQ